MIIIMNKMRGNEIITRNTLCLGIYTDSSNIRINNPSTRSTYTRYRSSYIFYFFTDFSHLRSEYVPRIPTTANTKNVYTSKERLMHIPGKKINS